MTWLLQIAAIVTLSMMYDLYVKKIVLSLFLFIIIDCLDFADGLKFYIGIGCTTHKQTNATSAKRVANQIYFEIVYNLHKTSTNMS